MTDGPRIMSDEEFHASALKGGASRGMRDNTVPDRGFMVGSAPNKDNIPYPEISRPIDQFSLNDVRQHARAIRDHFGGDSSIHQGAWKEGDNIVLDASSRHANFSDGITAGKTRGERAIYSVKHDKEISVKDVHPKN